MNRLRILRCGLAVTASLVFLAPPALANLASRYVLQAADPWAGVEEMVVLGGSSLGAQDFADADSVIAFGAEDLTAVGAQDIGDLADFTPNLEIVTSGATTPTFFIRGVGLNDFNSNSTGAVAIYQDGVAINAPAMQLGTLFDVGAGVTILRGPQGTGLNRNASAGAIKIYSKRPSGNVGGFLRADFGNYDYMDYEGAVEAPLYGDVLSARVAFRLSQRNGTMKNRCAGAPPIGARVPYPGPPAERGAAPWSHCGEVDPFPTSGSISDIPVGLEDRINDLNNWAARITFKFEPAVDAVPMTFFFNLHGARRDELTRLGQSYGTSGFFCINGDLCRLPRPLRPPDQAGTSASPGLLGARQGRSGTGYTAPEILKRMAELAPCTAEGTTTTGLNRCGLEAGETLAEAIADLTQENRAKILVAKELARDLDEKPYEGDFNYTGKTTNTVVGGWFEANFELPMEMALKTVTGVEAYDRGIDSDADFSPETLFHIFTRDDGWQVYQDLQLTGEFADLDNPIAWEVASWFLLEELNVEVDNDLGRSSSTGVGSRFYTQTNWSTGVSAHLTYDFWENFTADAGIRYNWDRKDLDYVLVPGSGAAIQATNIDEVWQAATGTFRLTYRLREDTSVFAKYTRGWKPGTFNATSAQNRPVTIGEPENIDSFEFGLDGSWFEDRVGFTGSFFYYSYADYQIFTIQQTLGTVEFVTLNANDAEVYGLEIESILRPFENTFINVRFSWLESEFLDFVQTNQIFAGGGLFQQDVQNSGNTLLNSPRFQVILTFEQTIPLGRAGKLVARYDGTWKDATAFDASSGLGNPNLFGQRFLPESTIGQQAYWLHNLRLSWKSPDDTIEVAGWVRNVEDQVYKSFAFDAVAFQNTTVYFVGDPRTFGTTVRFSF